MNERLPYEEQLSQQWNDLPLPDENMAWDDMKRRLEKDDDKPLLPIWQRGCAGWGLLGILLLGLGWWMVRPEKWFSKNTEKEKTTTAAEKGVTKEKDTAVAFTDTGITLAAKNMDLQKDSGNIAGKEAEILGVQQPAINSSDEVSLTTTTVGKEKNHTAITVNQPAMRAAKNKQGAAIISGGEGKTKKKVRNKQQASTLSQDGDKKKVQTDSLQLALPPVKKDTVAEVNTGKVVIKPDSTRQIKKDTVAEKQPLPKEEQTKKSKGDSTKRKKLVFSTGIALQQQLPLAGQKFVPYNSLGRKGTWRDYIPSVYVRLTRPGKWFLQSGFRYGAPQNTKEFLYQQKIVNDTGAVPPFTRTNSAILKKTYYHQLPLTFNYYILPGWSVGAGVQLNKFVSAVTENEFVLHNNIIGQDSIRIKSIGSVKGDSATEFKKTYLQAIIETQYHWRRFSFGARYTFGLQPYIQFTLPGGVPREENNRSLELFIRFELWKSKAKRLKE